MTFNEFAFANCLHFVKTVILHKPIGYLLFYQSFYRVHLYLYGIQIFAYASVAKANPSFPPFFLPFSSLFDCAKLYNLRFI